MVVVNPFKLVGFRVMEGVAEATKVPPRLPELMRPVPVAATAPLVAETVEAIRYLT